jgi:enamine deaminase RidA (YjgF/YER057c/UK114 family)
VAAAARADRVDREWGFADPTSGQGPLSPDDGLVGDGDFEAQARRTFENLRAVLDQAGVTFESIVKLGVDVTDISALPVYGRVKAQYIEGKQPADRRRGTRPRAPRDDDRVEAIAVA